MLLAIRGFDAGIDCAMWVHLRASRQFSFPEREAPGAGRFSSLRRQLLLKGEKDKRLLTSTLSP
jgi:hypothetical protein